MIYHISFLHNCTPQNPRPPQTPNVPIVGAQLRLLTSNLQSHTALGPRSWPWPCTCPAVTVCTTPPAAAPVLALLPIKSHSKTQQSSAPDASTPLWVLLQSMQFTDAPWPLSSRSAWPGCRTSRTRIKGESWLNVARRCASWGEAAMRRRGGGNGSAEGPPEPEARVGEEERVSS
jgi:hypothetical protein